ncbi:MAG: hypothetical protein R3304_10400 [Longimicrobiales bacterium]|nr:hypothetical protein [Longimicrobiales bacterium]
MKRSPLLLVGVVVTLLGAAGLVVDTVPFGEEEATVELGSLEASASVQRERRVPPLLAGTVLLVGLGISAYAARSG